MQAFGSWHKRLVDELQAEGVNIDEAALAEDDGLDYSSDMDVEEPGFVDPADGEFKRPWCPATRILEHRENERIERYGSHLQVGLGREHLLSTNH